MFMRIDHKTKTKDVLPLLTKERIDELISKVEPVKLDKPLLEFTIKEFAEVLNDESSYVSKLLREKRALIAFGKLKQFKIESENVAKFLKMFEIKQTPEERAAQANIVFPNFIVHILITLVEFFHLKSFEEAETYKLSDFLTIHQYKCSNAQYQVALNKIYTKKSKKK